MLISAAHWRPRIRRKRSNQPRQPEPRAGLVGSHLKRGPFGVQVYRELQVLASRGTQRQRRQSRGKALVVRERSQVQVPCPFGIAGQIRKKLAMSSHAEFAFLIRVGKEIRRVVTRDGPAVIGKLRVAQLITLS